MDARDKFIMATEQQGTAARTHILGKRLRRNLMAYHSILKRNPTGEINTVFNVFAVALVLALFIADMYFMITP